MQQVGRGVALAVTPRRQRRQTAPTTTIFMATPLPPPPGPARPSSWWVAEWVAVFEAKVAASHMINDTTTTPDYAGIPTAVFTIPELARVGPLQSEARAAGIDLAVRHFDTRGWYSDYRIDETPAARMAASTSLEP